jgi:hypothetical protein
LFFCRAKVARIGPGDKALQGEGPHPRLDNNWAILEIKEFIETSATAVGVVGISSRDFRPYKFGSLEGFRVEFLFTTEDGLLREGFTVGAKKDKKLYLIIYSGARLHYYPKNKGDDESIVQSIKMNKESTGFSLPGLFPTRR